MGCQSSGDTPLHVAVFSFSKCYPERTEELHHIVDVLIFQGADVNAVNNAGDSCLYLALLHLGIDTFRLFKCMRTGFQTLFNDKKLADCSIVLANKKAVMFHKKVFLTSISSSSSVYFEMDEPETNQIEMPDVSEQSVLVLLKFLYGFEIKTEQIDEKMAAELLKVAQEYGIFTLEKLVMEEFKL